ncbi:MAG: hypothetical protein ABFR62_01625 [Bacteroidota bacterium]
MRNLKRLATSLVAIALVVAFSSCEKQPVAKDGAQEVTIAINNLTNSLKKATVEGENTGDLPECSDAEADYAVVGLIDPNGKPVASMHLPILTNLDDGTQTVVVKTKTLGEYTIDLFEVYDAEDNLIWAAPKPDSEYYDWVTNKIGDTFTVEAFKKIKVDIDVLCWQPYSYKEFGYYWFDFDRTEIKTLCFFGDICVLDPEPWADFFLDGGDPLYDMPAVYNIRIMQGENLIASASNITEEKPISGPLCIEYPYHVDGEPALYMVYFEIYHPYSAQPLTVAALPLNPADDPQVFLDHWMNTFSDDDEDGVDDDGIFDFVIQQEGAECNWEYNQDVNAVMTFDDEDIDYITSLDY